MNLDGTLSKDELIALAKTEFKKYMAAVKAKDIVEGNLAIKNLKLILDSAINELDLNNIWYVGEIQHKARTFCFTGKFEYGDRKFCESTAEENGAIIEKNVTLRLDYLVVGGEKNPDWAHQNYGRKIERALEIQKQKSERTPHIISESDWVKSL